LTNTQIEDALKYSPASIFCQTWPNLNSSRRSYYGGYITSNLFTSLQSTVVEVAPTGEDLTGFKTLEYALGSGHSLIKEKRIAELRISRLFMPPPTWPNEIIDCVDDISICVTFPTNVNSVQVDEPFLWLLGDEK